MEREESWLVMTEGCGKDESIEDRRGQERRDLRLEKT